MGFATGQAAGGAAPQCGRDGETNAGRVRTELVRLDALIAAPKLERNPL
jgi:hypothetical protein